MNEALPIQILLATMLGTTGLNFLFTRLHVICSALSVKLYCRQELNLPEKDAKGSTVFHDGLLDELRRAGRNLLYAMYAALALMLFLWLFGRQEMYADYLDIIFLLMKIAGAACVFSEASRIIAALLLPAEITCRGKVISALNSNILSLILVILFYVAAAWLYSL